MEVWKPKSREDHLLQVYLATLGGAAYMEVPVGEDKPPGTRRKIDAVRIQGPAGSSSEKWKFRNSSAQGFWTSVSAASEVEVVEVKDQLGAWVIGQAYAGKHLMENRIASKKTKVKAVVVCREGPDRRLADGLLQVCQALDVTVWTAKADLGAHKAKRDLGPALELIGRPRSPNKCPTRRVIGQLIVAKQLLNMAHSGLDVKLVIDCTDPGNVSLGQVCEQLGIEVRPTILTAGRS